MRKYVIDHWIREFDRLCNANFAGSQLADFADSDMRRILEMRDLGLTPVEVMDEVTRYSGKRKTA